MTNHGKSLSSTLPEHLADSVVEQLLDTDQPEEVVRSLSARFPNHAKALQELARDFSGAERLLQSAFTGAESQPPDFGPYRVVGRLGEGVFGTVYLCEQQEPVQRRVAIKALRPGAGDQDTLARFESERQLLANLNHPAMTQVYDAGTLPDGRPFFVMEYVDGLPITRYALQASRADSSPESKLEEQLRLIVEVCRGVEHAHQCGVVHRDLKPANILVIDTADGPRPKIIDFGIAKAMARAPTQFQTSGGRVVGTHGYMSPEQAQGLPDQIDRRSDTFALGVLLFELLTRELPWGYSPEAPTREAPKPSALVRARSAKGHSGSQPTESSTRNEMRVPKELDWITGKALALSPAHRYQTAAALAADIERFLRNEAVEANPPSWSYLASKTVHRHRSILVAIAIAAGLLAIGWAALWTRRDTADAEIATANSAAEAGIATATRALDQLLLKANDLRLLGTRAGSGVRQALLDDAVSMYDDVLQHRPEDPGLMEGRCIALMTLAEVHVLLGEFARAESFLIEAKAEATELHRLAPNFGRVRYAILADVRRKLARIWQRTGRVYEARQELALAVRELDAHASTDPRSYGRSLAAALREWSATMPVSAESVQICRRGIEILSRHVRQEKFDAKATDDLVFARIGLGENLVQLNELDLADQELQKALTRLPRLRRGKARAASTTHGLLGHIALRRGDLAKAVRQLHQALQLDAERLREEPRNVGAHSLHVAHRAWLGLAHERSGAWDTADRSFDQALRDAESLIQDFPEDPTRSAEFLRAAQDYLDVLRQRARPSDEARVSEWTSRIAAMKRAR